ncbi:MAG TPA: hypothetical protein VN636_11275, partial [Acidimicrobiia bacterium]|nr:hypothetical protein [Acidimicrobiia bacterium]
MQLGTLARGVVASSDATGAVEGAGWRLSWRLLVGEQWTAPGAGAPLRRSRPYAAPVDHLATRIAGGDAIARAYAVDRPDAVVVEIENDSPAAIGAALLLRASGAYALSSRRPPRASETDGAVVFPIAHRTTLRVAVAAGAVDVRALPGVDAVVRGWDRLLDRGMRVEVPDPLQGDVDRARADLLLAPPSAATFAALEAWGFDDEAVACWERLGM